MVLLEQVSAKELRRTQSLLKHAIAILNKGWCVGMFAATPNGKGVTWSAKSATKFCASGALHKASTKFTRDRNSVRSLAATLLDSKEVLAPHDADCLVQFNDSVAKDKRAVTRKFSKASNFIKRELSKRTKN